MTRRRKEPEPREIVRFIAEYESLSLTCDEFGSLKEDRLRQILRDFSAPPESAAKQTRAKRQKERVSVRNALKVEVFTDGASRGNPGPAGAGWVITDGNGEVLIQGHLFLGRRTDNEAEYEAVIHGLKKAVGLGAKAVSLRSDSQLLVRQINGQNRIKSPRLENLHRAAREIMQGFSRFDARRIPSKENDRADAEANRAIDEAPAKEIRTASRP